MTPAPIAPDHFASHSAEQLEEAMQAPGADGRPRYLSDSLYRNRLEARRFELAKAAEASSPPAADSVPPLGGLDPAGLDRARAAAGEAGIAPDVLAAISGAMESAAGLSAQGQCWTEEPFQLHDYTVAVAGVAINRAAPELYAALRAARQAGLSQQEVDRMLAEYAGS